MAGEWLALVDCARTNQSAALALACPDGETFEWWDDGGPRAVECMSVTKLVVAMALGLAVSASELRVPLRTWIGEWAGSPRGEVTLAEVLSHRSGLAVGSPASVYAAPSVRSLVLDCTLESSPGSGFAYNNLAFHLAGLVAERASGRPLDSLAGEGLFAPLGIVDWSWQRDPEGFPLCMAGLQLQALDLARIGCLHLTGGAFGGVQVLPAEWLAALAPSARGEVGLGCFAQFTRSDDELKRVGFGHDGYLGQWITIQPSSGVVAVRFRTTDDEDPALIWPTFPSDVYSSHEPVGPLG